MATTKTFSLYLAKEDVQNLDDLLTESAREMVERDRAQRIRSDAFADRSVLFTFPGVPATPKWVGILTPTFAMPARLFSQSPCALLAFQKDQRIFAITFSYAHVYLDLAKTEADFGLKVAINAVSDAKLRSVERSNIGAAIRDFAQAAGQRDLRSFGFDEALDLIRKVSGYATDDDFADLLTGSRSLRFSKKMELVDVPEAAVEAVRIFGLEAYKETAFRIIDFLSPVSDIELAGDLNNNLVEAIRNGSDEFEIAIPDILPTAAGSFRFEQAGFSRFQPDVSIDLYRECLGDDLPNLTFDDIKKHRVAAYAEEGDSRIDHWSVRDSLVGSLVRDTQRYALNEGVWYRIDQAYKDAADQKFVDLHQGPDATFIPLRRIYPAKAKGQKQKPHYQSEESYNEEIAAGSTYLLMDQKLVEIADEPGRGIEACDLLDIPGRRFIHVKKSSRQSSILSHFFKQGGNAAQLLRKYEPFRAGLIAKVREHHGDEHAAALETALSERWTVEFQIADVPRRDGNFDIPFFSKLTLRDEALNMDAMGFDVSVRFIRLVPAT